MRASIRSMDETALSARFDRLEERLEAIDGKLDELRRGRGKTLDWIGQLSEHIASLDAFREEVRASFEPILRQLERLDEVGRIQRHATADISRRMEALESTRTPTARGYARRSI